MRQFPYLPKDGAAMEEGEYWDIIQGGRYGFGVCLGRWHRGGILAGILRLTKSSNLLEPSDPILIHQTGYMDLKSIKYCGGQVRGQIDIDVKALVKAGLKVTNRTLSFSEPRSIVLKAMKFHRSNPQPKGGVAAVEGAPAAAD